MVEDDPWCAHALVHTYEMEGRFKEGLNFIHETENNWNVSINMNSDFVNFF